jgi:hypothetical protein
MRIVTPTMRAWKYGVLCAVSAALAVGADFVGIK